MFYAGEGQIIRNIIDNEYDISPVNLTIFLVVYFLFFCITYGTFVPAGLFLPGMVIGCVIGALYSIGLRNLGWFNHLTDEEVESLYMALIILGCASMLAGYTRMTYAICVIMMETSMRLDMFVNIVFVVFISNFIGDFFTRGLY